MVASQRRHGSGSIYLMLGVLLLLAFAGLAVYHKLTAARYASDAQLLAELEAGTLIETTPPLAGDWPQWRGPSRDGVVSLPGMRTQWPSKGPKMLWQAECGEGYSGVSVAGGRAFTLSQGKNEGEEVVLCWDASTGKELWRREYPCPATAFKRDQGLGPRSSPTLDGDRLYTVGVTGVLQCLDVANGNVHWRHELLGEFAARNPEWGVSFSPLIEDDLLIAMPGGPNGNSLAAFNKRTGELAWKGGDDPAGYSSPLAATLAGRRHVLCFMGNSLVSVAPNDGQLLWRYPWETAFQVNAAMPLVFSMRQADGQQADYVFLSSNYGKGCAVLRVVDGGGGRLEARRVYESNQMGNHFNSSVRYKDHFYGFHEAELTCMEVRTGRIAWKKKGFSKGSLLRVDDHLLILGELGQLALAEATPDAYQELASARLSRKKTWTPLTVADGKLYWRDQEQVVCYELK
jgi:outer membrane protein assembly factor BamB